MFFLFFPFDTTQPTPKTHAKKTTTTKYRPGDSIRDLFIPDRWRFERVTFSPSQKGHQQNICIYIYTLDCDEETCFIKRIFQQKTPQHQKQRKKNSKKTPQTSKKTPTQKTPNTKTQDLRPFSTTWLAGRIPPSIDKRLAKAVDLAKDIGLMWTEKQLGRIFWADRDMDVSENNGTPKSSNLMGFSIIFTIHFGVPLVLETPGLCWLCANEHWMDHFPLLND